MTDVSRTIYSGDWELYPRNGRVEIQDTTHAKIVLNVWVERNAREV